MVMEDDGDTDTRGKKLKFFCNNDLIADILLSSDHYNPVSTLETAVFDEAAEFRLKQGIVSVDQNIVIQYHFLENGEATLVVADIKGKRLLYCSKVALEKQQHSVTIPYKAGGGTWEGDVCEDSPCGWGRWYEENGQLHYEGFRVDSTAVCYGTVYAPDGKAEYRGMMCDGKTTGFGCLFPDDETLYDEWIVGRPILFLSLRENTPLPIHTRLEKLVLADKTGNDLHNTVCITCFNKLTELSIGSSCFRNATGFECRHLPELKSIVIGEKSFTAWTKWTRPPSEPRRAHFVVEDCPWLSALSIARYSFSDFASFTVRELPSLYALTLGEKGTGARCFSYASLTITGPFYLLLSHPDLPLLARITFGKACFQFARHSTLASVFFSSSSH